MVGPALALMCLPWLPPYSTPLSLKDPNETIWFSTNFLMDNILLHKLANHFALNRNDDEKRLYYSRTSFTTSLNTEPNQLCCKLSWIGIHPCYPCHPSSPYHISFWSGNHPSSTLIFCRKDSCTCQDS